MGRPTKFTPEIKERILEEIRQGATYDRACLLSGIDTSTLCAWKKAGKEALSNGICDKFSEFLEDIKQAEEEYIKMLQESVNTHSKNDGKLALEVLARKRPDEFGRKDSIQIKGKLDINKFDIKLTDEERTEFHKRFKGFFGLSDDIDGQTD